MYLLDTGADERALVTSASDLTLASGCEFAFLRTLDLRLDRLTELPKRDDPMLERAARLGDEHEQRIAAEYAATIGGVVEIPRPKNTVAGLREAEQLTVEALRASTPVVWQATFFDETDAAAPFVGYADFLQLRPDGRYRVLDSKLARSAKVTALMQLAAYHAQLERLGIPVDDTVELLLGDGTTSEHAIDDIRPVHLERRARLLGIAAEHRAEAGIVAWGDPRYTACGRCEICAPEVEQHRDPLLVAGMRATQRAKLVEVGITTIEALAAHPQRPDGCTIPEKTYAVLQAQAALQVRADEQGAGAHDPAGGADAPRLPVVMFAPQTIADLPAPDDGDLFFDFEGDPLWRADRPTGGPLWGIDYLFGMVDTSEVFTAFWAHDAAEERQALLDFLDFVRARRVAHPGLHIYHYAPYERTHLLSIAARYGVGEHEVDELLRSDVLVDLYGVVKKSVRVGTRSYSIKKLEPLYMGDELRDADGVTTGADSVVQYRAAMDARALGDDDQAQRILDDIRDYNRYDCVSTRRLRDWLLALGAEHGALPGTSRVPPHPEEAFEPSGLAEGLRAAAADAATPADAEAYRLASAAIDYHARENKTFWAEHFARLSDPEELWADARGVMIPDAVEVAADWATGPRGATRRVLRVTGTWAPGSSTKTGDVFLLYRQPAPYVKPGRRPGAALDVGARIVEVDEATGCVTVEESAGSEEGWPDLPFALTPGAPPRGGSVAEAIESWGRGVLDRAPVWPAEGSADALRSLPPRATPAPAVPAVPSLWPEAAEHPDDTVRAVVASCRRLDRSYLAVQGPPGTGKTYLAARVIAELVREHGWAIGVVAQSHTVVEHLLDGIVEAGLPGSLVGKSPKQGEPRGAHDDHGFTELRGTDYEGFAVERAGSGYVLGGTAWTFSNTKRVAKRQLDLLVIDEAGQFSLAATIGAGVSAKRLLLLGDPQQLPQVSQGTHPAPVDGSALGWISAGHDVLPPELGYFLAETRRMHPALTEAVSRLAYAGRLRAHPSTAERSLEGVAPGLHPVAVVHSGNATESPEEATEVLRIVRRHLGRAWTAALGADPRPLGEADLIVVTPYNAQVERLRRALDAAGHPGVRVGTVDRFQGQEAVIAIVSMAASSAAEIARGLGFLLSRNRLNVAISRAQWAAYLVHSPALADALPYSAEELADLSRFLELTRVASP